MKILAAFLFPLSGSFLAACSCGELDLGGDVGWDGGENRAIDPVPDTEEQDYMDANGYEIDAICHEHPLPEGWVCILAGVFTMGIPEGRWGAIDMTQHEVTLTVDFAMMDHELTQGEFQDLMGYNPSYFTECGTDCPVDSVMWYEAIACANALSRRDGLPECFYCDVFCDLKSDYSRPQDCPGYRLPTDAEWEYAARAGTITEFYNGDLVDQDCDDMNLNVIGWYCGNSEVAYPGCISSDWQCQGPHSIKQMIPNPWGLYDMSGNLREWAWDWYGDFPGPVTDPIGPESGLYRVIRNAGFYETAKACRSGHRGWFAPNAIYNGVGFRLVRSLLP
jgi:formylglycine-generating enzyme required for sulfatase activity